MFHSKNGLSYKIVGSMAMVFLCILIILAMGAKIIFEQTAEASEKQKADLILQTIEKPVQMAIYLKFYDQIEQKIAPAISISDVREVFVYDQAGTVLYGYRNKQKIFSQREALSVKREVHEPISGALIGTIALQYRDLTYDESRQYMYKILYAIGLPFAVIFFIAVWWVRYLMSPLRNIAAKVRHYKPGDCIEFDEDGSTEIEQIVVAFKEMQKTTAHYMEQMKATNTSLETTVQEKTRELANHYFMDQLTGLPNRYRLQEELIAEEITAIAIVNVDDFKEINDFFGISTGDSVLIQIGGWLNELTGICYRLGSDEFALTFSGEIDQKELEHRLTTLINLTNEKTFMAKEEEVNIRVTIGVSMGKEKALSRADIALHHAKLNKTPIAFYNEDEGVEETYRSNLLMASNVRRALFDRRIICHYQPVVDFQTGEIKKYETLVRMVDEEGKIIMPMEFLPIAKQTKLYPQITLEVLHQACLLFASREEEFSINLSDSDIRNPHTVEEIIKTITQTGTASRIVFEILESEGIENYEEVSRFIGRVKSLGAKIAIDDFGTGYSNFENILKLHVDFIKIDGSLIREILSNDRHQIIVETIIDFSQKIGAKTIAEFVGDQETYDLLKSLNVEFSQGYFTGKPISLEY
jgi:c-di-GMP phosphodiesterase